MNTQTLKITPPAGFEIDKTNSTFECIVFKAIEPELPKRWEDLKELNGFYIGELCDIKEFKYDSDVHNVDDCKDVWPTRELVEASIALAQLCQLRDVYNDGWVADYKNGNTKPTIIVTNNKLNANNTVFTHCIMAFKS